LEILETETDLKDGPLILPPESAHGAIEWRGVNFRYRSEMPVLRSIDLTVEPGMKVAVVGATGAGKSTMLGCCPAFRSIDRQCHDRRRRCPPVQPQILRTARSRWYCNRR